MPKPLEAAPFGLRALDFFRSSGIRPSDFYIPAHVATACACGGLLLLGRWRGRWFAEIELNFWRSLGARRGGKIGPFFEAEHAGIENRRERFDGGVVRLHCFIEITSLDTDPVFGALELRLQVLEILRG